ncbi:YhcN/YlaJ family sporulation lipoprotein [Microaerobacter geothermalis]|uniref:YhcN/YlaJ family sporulation lipoprotein n=1 Tax=Microaerobacter geothermalis TaxID=674972 RepID=UPI001F3C2E1F|nr:YhcN/YlaJ family sporulation lipoprotein [Microaerobacter geothermalis]MCF6093730.1 YhcN/YlaJ family sporulation lipoprotein [Microaerobacter geothermalis]
MKKIYAKKWLLLFALVLVVSSLAACANYRGAAPDDNNRNNYGTLGVDGTRPYGVTPYNNRYVTPGTYGYDNRYSPYGTNIGPMNNFGNNRFGTRGFNAYNTNDLAERMADAAARVRGVDNASVLISGNNVLVGIDVDSRSRKSANQIESQVRAAINRVQPGFDVFVTSDRRFTQRIAGLNNNRLDTNDFNGILNDMRRGVTRPMR